MDESRKQFEQAYEQLRKDGQTINLWDVWRMAWQASRAAIEIELPEACSCCYSESEKEWHDSVMGEVTDILNAAGIKVKE